MHLLPELSLCRPETVEEAARLLASEAGARVIAGGTGLLANLRLGLGQAASLVSLERVPGATDIAATAGSMRLGAAVSLARLASDALVRDRLPALAEAARTVAGPAHRSAATLGGNLCLDTRCVYYNQGEAWRRSNGYCLKHGGDICHVAPQGKRCHAAYSADLAPALLVMQTEVEIAHPGGVRCVPLGALYRDDGAHHLTLGCGEFVAAAIVPDAAPGTRVGYRKASARGAIDFPLAGVAMAMRLEQGRVGELRVALTGTNSQPLLLAGTQELCGGAPDAALADKLAKLVQRQTSPQRTTVTASHYRRQVATALARRLVTELGTPA